jgi:hypothetical protein
MTKIADIAKASKSESFRKLNPGFFGRPPRADEMVYPIPNPRTGEVINMTSKDIMSMTEVGMQLKPKDELERLKSNITQRPSLDEQKLNKTEKAFLNLLRHGSKSIWIGIQAITLKLGDDCRYTPDFFALHQDGSLHAIEVKGFWRDDARVKIKVAARMYSFIQFTAAQYKNKAWHYEEIKP